MFGPTSGILKNLCSAYASSLVYFLIICHKLNNQRREKYGCGSKLNRRVLVHVSIYQGSILVPVL